MIFRMLFLVAGLGGAAVYLQPGGALTTPTQSGAQPAARAARLFGTDTVRHFRIWVAGIETSCRLAIDMADGSVSAGRCGDGYDNPLAAATHADRLKGGISLRDQNNGAIAEFAESEGFAYEAVVPAGRLMALASAD